MTARACGRHGPRGRCSKRRGRSRRPARSFVAPPPARHRAQVPAAAMANLLLTANQMLASGISKEFHDLVKSISECQSRQVRHRNGGPGFATSLPLTPLARRWRRAPCAGAHRRRRSGTSRPRRRASRRAWACPMSRRCVKGAGGRAVPKRPPPADACRPRRPVLWPPAREAANARVPHPAAVLRDARTQCVLWLHPRGQARAEHQEHAGEALRCALVPRQAQRRNPPNRR